jgi:hypothetical protein
MEVDRLAMLVIAEELDASNAAMVLFSFQR